MSIDVWIFDVGRGFCAAIRSPNGHLCLVDCGCSDDFSPVKWLSGKQWTPRKGYALTKFIVTHPHIDHISDIENLTQHLEPSMILRRTNLSWDKVTSSGSGETDIMSHYVSHYMPPEYDHTVPDTEMPAWGNGFTLMSRRLGETKAVEVSATDSAYVNNSSFVTVLKYLNFCIVFPGDIQSEGMAALLEQSQGLRSVISGGVDFYITPHHGHASGFSSDWFKVTGATNILNIASERRKRQGEDESQTKVDPRYSQEAYCHGNNREERRLVSTKTGHIHLWVADDGGWGWEQSRL